MRSMAQVNLQVHGTYESRGIDMRHMAQVNLEVHCTFESRGAQCVACVTLCNAGSTVRISSWARRSLLSLKSHDFSIGVPIAWIKRAPPSHTGNHCSPSFSVCISLLHKCSPFSCLLYVLLPYHESIMKEHPTMLMLYFMKMRPNKVSIVKIWWRGRRCLILLWKES